METLVLSQVGLFSLWLLGISVGFTACTASCLPYMGSWVLSRNQGMRGAIVDTAWFAAGKIAAYATLGAIAGTLGNTLLALLKTGLGNALIGGASVLAGAWLIRSRQVRHRSCGIRNRQHMHPLLLGFSLSFIPCAPLAAVLAACAAAASSLTGFKYGLAFGLGAALTPLFVVLPLLGGLGRELRLRHPWLENWLVYLGGVVLVIIGLRRMALVI